MTKKDAVDFMMKKVEEIERERLSHDIDPRKQRQEAVDAILKALKGVQISDAD